MTPRSIPFPFMNSRGHRLAGLIDMPAETPRFYGVFAPCFTCTKEAHAAHKICRRLSLMGGAMLRFDGTGTGFSKGDFTDTNFSTRVDDILSAVRAFEEEHGTVTLLVGHSIGGTAALSAVKSLPNVEALATLGSPSDPAYVIEKWKRNGQMELLENDMTVVVAGRKVPLKKSFIDDMHAHDVPRDTASFDKSLFIFHAPHDEIVNFDNARTIYGRANCDKELLSLSESATHLLERGDADADFIAGVLTDAL